MQNLEGFSANPDATAPVIPDEALVMEVHTPDRYRASGYPFLISQTYKPGEPGLGIARASSREDAHRIVAALKVTDGIDLDLLNGMSQGAMAILRDRAHQDRQAAEQDKDELLDALELMVKAVETGKYPPLGLASAVIAKANAAKAEGRW